MIIYLSILSIRFDSYIEKIRKKIARNIIEWSFWMIDKQTYLLVAHSCGIERSVKILAWWMTADRVETMRP